MASTAVIIAHGELELTPEVQALIARADLLICADGGLCHAAAHGWKPQLVVGDLDSAPAELVAEAAAQGVRIERHPCRKDETDTELALRAALAAGAEEVYLLAATGDRLDHALANILMLALPEAAQARVVLLAGRQQVQVIRGEACIEGQPGDLVSLLPIGGDAVGIHTSGLEYALEGETLPFGIPRGVSNVLTQSRATVRVERGLLLAVLTPTGAWSA
ncbi:MAG: thiamine diphosphokinase [Anaerolineae bacterium]